MARGAVLLLAAILVASALAERLSTPLALRDARLGALEAGAVKLA